jgi:hypothetical protein
MTYEQALEIRKWRVDKGCSWGRIGELALEIFNLGTGGQMSGYDLCVEAAKFFNEDPNDELWN